ncbi:MAG: aspartate carbamoyltransferase catalytic subunit [Deltaproteobacteria bacterium]|nr:aspartate carbamoyltransferase catalytic subunit [Deltaproteobacteria bacterium]
MMWTRKDVLGLADLSVDEIQTILDTAESFKEINRREIKKVPTLRGKTVVNLFYEPSTRTRTSFEIAAKRLSADTVNFTPSSSSVGKGETLLDTVRNIEAMHPAVIVVRHPNAGTPHLLSRRVGISVVNAGDGAHEHPSQALLDMLMIREAKGRIEGLTISIVGDISHSRVARSNILGLKKMGANVRICGPATMIPPAIDRLGVEVFHDMDAAIHDADVIMMLRIQLERQTGALFPSNREYARFYGLNEARLERAKPDAIIMHPGPMNRGVEISSDVADSTRSKILDQVSNGVAVRMAILYLLAGRKAGDEDADREVEGH